MGRRHLVAGLTLLTVATVAGILLWPRGARPCRATFEQVREGMSWQEVIRTVGAPPGDYTTSPTVGVNTIYEIGEAWLTDDAELLVIFDSSGRARRVEINTPVSLPRPSLWECLCDRLGL